MSDYNHKIHTLLSTTTTILTTTLLPIFPTSYTTTQPHHLLIFYTLYSTLKSTSTYRYLHDSILSILASCTDTFLPLVYTGLIPDVLIRWGIRIRCRSHLVSLRKDGVEGEMKMKQDIIQNLKSMKDIAIETDSANEQHYEVPARFYDLCLGPRKKYSSGYWPPNAISSGGALKRLELSEVAMLELYCERAGVKDGMKIVDLGCGWGSLTLFLLERYPNCVITGISNSYSQREYILKKTEEMGGEDVVGRVNIITCNVSDDKGALDGVRGNDLCMSIEMFEHMKNYSQLLSKIHTFLSPNGKLFVHIFAHLTHPYHFTTNEKGSWLADNFFTGGTMPSDDLLLYFNEHFACSKHWRVNGSHYERTSNAWLELMDENWRNGSGELRGVLEEAYGVGKGVEWYVKWRLFYLSCAELFGLDGGSEYVVSHYLFHRR